MIFYGLRSFQAVFKCETLHLKLSQEFFGLKATLVTAIALSLLNPHVYLDTVLLLGSIGARFPAHERIFFALGAIMASFTWFFTLGYGARYLGPLFREPLSWKILDFIIGCMMWGIAFSLFL